MSNIEENAFQLARYLLEHPGKMEQIEIRNDLELSEQDFHFALKYLVDAGDCHTAGQVGKGIIIDKNLVELQNFVNRMGDNRILLSREAEQLLKFLVVKLPPNHPFFPCLPIMNQFKWSETQYMQVAQELEDNGMVEDGNAGGNPFNTISVTSTGRQTIRNNFYAPVLRESPIHVEQMVTNINGNYGIVNIGSILTSVNQAVQANSRIEPSAKQELEALLQQLEKALQDIPAENGDDAEAVAEMAKDLIEKATKEKPNKPLVKISADGLKKAAENIVAITPKVLLTANAIITFINMMYR